MSEPFRKIDSGEVEKLEVELPLSEKYKDEATRIVERDDLLVTGNPTFYFQSKSLNIRSFNIKRFSKINYNDNLDSIVNYIKDTVSDDVDGIKIRSGDHDFAVTFFNVNEKHEAKQIGQDESQRTESLKKTVKT